MINKIFKTIHNRYSKFIKFFFFLRYLFIIFLIITSIFFSIPKLFDYKKHENIIKEHLSNKYNLEIRSLKAIQYDIFPSPNLSIAEVKFELKNKKISTYTKKINIFLNLKSIYNLKNLVIKKIVFKDSDISLKIKNVRFLFEYLDKLKNRLTFTNLNLNLTKDDQSIINIKKIYFSNFGFKKNKITGLIFEKDFKVLLRNNYNKINLKILETGVKAEFLINPKSSNDSIQGNSKINITGNLIKFEFNVDKNQLILTKASLRNRDLNINFDSIIKLNPFFYINSKVVIKEFNNKLFKKINLEKILKNNKKIIQKLNLKSSINYNSKRFSSSFLESYSSSSSLAYGRLYLLDKAVVSGGEISCKSESNVIDPFPRIEFLCSIKIKDLNKLLKKLSISKKLTNNKFDIYFEGSLNILSKKINFKKITNNDDYLANKEDLKYFKEIFERNLFDEDFFDIFKKNKIIQFISEII